MGLIADTIRKFLLPAGEPTDELATAAPDAKLPDVSGFLLGPSPAGLDWASFHDTRPVRRWADDVRSALRTRQEEDWRLAGPGLIVECEDPDELESMLRMIADESGMRMARIPDDSLAGLGSNIRSHFAAIAPVIVQLSVSALESEFMELEGGALTSVARDRLGTFAVEHPVLIVGYTDDLSEIGEGLLAVGVMDRQVRLAPADKRVLGQRFLDMLGADTASEELRRDASKVGLLVRGHYRNADDRQLAALHLRRIARAEGRPIEFGDVINLAIRGAVEQSPEATRQPTQPYRRKVAYHEAGHACIAVIESQGRAVPDYASIVPAPDFAGVVMQSLHFIDGVEEFTFNHLLLRVRIGLAGRAAEELFFGSPNVSDGPDSDLHTATRLAYIFFARSGFHASMAREGVSGMNLAVEMSAEIDSLQNDRISGEVRSFLAEQYAHVVAVLKEHRAFVDAVVDRLMWDPVVDQEEMSEIAKAHGFDIPAGP